MSADIVEPVVAAMLYRAAAEVEVTTRQRLVHVLAVPYDTDEPINDEEGIYTESIARSAFTGLDAHPERVRAFRDHTPRGTLIGVARSIDTRATDGLHSEVFIARTPMGDETLELAEAGALSVSIGALKVPGGDQWNRARTRVVRRALNLRELAFVPWPAYKGAGVLAVRAESRPAAPQVSARAQLLARSAEPGSPEAQYQQLHLERAQRVLAAEYDHLSSTTSVDSTERTLS